MQKKCWYNIIVLLCFTFSLYGKEIPLFHLGVENGLPSNTVYSITRQNNGYLWFSTNKGLSRFNGINFKNFSTFDNLPDNDVLNTTEDGDGRLWLSTFGGYLCYFKNDTFHTAKNTPWLALPFNSPILRNCSQKEGMTNVIFSDQTKFVNIHHEKLRVIPIKSSVYLLKNLLNVKSLKNDQFELTYNDHVSIINNKGEEVDHHFYKVKDEHFLIVANSNDFSRYYCTPKGIYTLNEELIFPLKKTFMDLKFQVPTSISRNNILIGFFNKLTINDSLSVNVGSHITFITKDVDKDFWISTLGGGVYYLSKYYNDLEEYNNAYNEKIVYAKIINNNLYFVNNKGWLYVKKGDVTKCIYRNNEANTFYSKSNFLITDKGDFITFTKVKMFVLPDIFKDKVEKPVTLSFDGGMIKEMLQDGDKAVTANIFTLLSFNPHTFVATRQLRFDTLVDDYKVYKRIYARAFDPSDHALWYAQKDRVSKLINGKAIVQSQFSNITCRSLNFLNNYLIAIKEDNNLSVFSNYQNNKTKEKIISLPDCIWESVIPLNNHSALICTNNYYRLLTLFPPDKSGAPQYSIETIESPFLPKQAEYVISDTVNSYFFKDSFITSIPNKIFFGKVEPPIPVFSSLKTLKKTYAVSNRLEVSYDEARNLNIQIDNISFLSKDPITEYSISEDDKESWNNLNGNEINMTTPSFGTYTIKVRSKTISSNYSVPITVTLIIDKPFWAKWWFVLLIFAVLIGLIYFTIVLLSQRRIRNKQKEHDAEFKYQQSEYKALNALMNPHFVFNSLNNIQGLINRDDKETANQYLVVFANLIRQNMRNISLGLISLEQELHLVGNYLSLEKLRFKDLVNFEVIIDEDVEMDDIMIPPLLIQPLVENAIIHGLLPLQSTESKVIINVYEKADIVYISIKDNGIGLTKSLENKAGGRDSYGLLNLNRRIEHLKKFQKQEINFSIQEILDEGGNVKGTESMITINLE
jgi:two-component sensor histidine kinase